MIRQKHLSAHDGMVTDKHAVDTLAMVRTGSLILFLSGAALLVYTFLPYVREEAIYSVRSYQSRQKGAQARVQPLEPVSTEFGIVIPKIGANAAVIASVDPNNSRMYQAALTKGVAHAAGTKLPGEDGNMFLFSHSSATLLDANRYNSVFYLLGKLGQGDEIDIYYQNRKIPYQVTSKKIVAATDVSFLSPTATSPKLTLMSCWPPGTSYKRLIIEAQPSTPQTP